MNQLGDAMDLDFFGAIAPESENVNHTGSILGKRKVEEAIEDESEVEEAIEDESEVEEAIEDESEVEEAIEDESKVEDNKVDLSKYATAPTDLKARVKGTQYNFNCELRRWRGEEWSCPHDLRQGRCIKCKAEALVEDDSIQVEDKDNQVDLSKYSIPPIDVKSRIKNMQYNFNGELRRWKGAEWNCVHDRRQGRCTECKDEQANPIPKIKTTRRANNPNQRIIGMQYNFKGELRRWNGKEFYCVHDRRLQRCVECIKAKRLTNPAPIVNIQPEAEMVAPTINTVIDLSHYLVAPSDTKQRVKGVQYNLNGELRRWDGYHWTCQQHDVSGFCFECRKDPKPTLDETDSHLATEWCKEENGPMSDYTRGSPKAVWFQCTQGHAKYQTSLKTRVRAKVGCRECVNDNQRKYSLELVEAARIRSKTSINSTEIGDETELYIFNLLKDIPSFKSVQNIGAIGDRTDTVITLPDGEAKSLQVKTISHYEIETNKGLKHKYMLGNDKIYPGDMLLAAVSRDRTVFAVEFFKNLTDPVIHFGGVNSKYNKCVFRNSIDFVNKIVELIPFSIQMTESVSANTKAEIDSLKRLEQVCIKMGLTYKRNTTNGNTVDCFINNRPIQAKFRTKQGAPGTLTYSIDFTKSAGSINGDSLKQPYSADDPFEFVIVEVAGVGADKEKYFSQFLVIPKKVLTDRKVLATDTEKGKTSFHVCTPDYTADHWSKKYWDDFSPFVPPIVQ